jgi:hexosaminidase
LQNLPNKVILSPVDKLYLDCGAGNQFGGVSWCEPYKTWKVIYSFDPLAGGVIDRSRIMGGVGTLWSEEVLPD